MNIENGCLNALAAGWQSGSGIAMQTGFRYTVVTGTDQANTGGGFDRPNGTGQNPNIDNPTTARWFNTDAFVRQPFGTFGDIGRNTMIGPNVFQWDASALKNFN